ncbi:MAG: hypothetical protein KAI47_20885, partial [Deltaproteobacteria bacterium]|nr:hypothetical protein [Deltaproteobacteria bacterium]
AGWHNAVTTVSGYQWHDRLSAVWAVSPSEVWAVGKSGVVAHSLGLSPGGTKWFGERLFGASDFNGVWASGSGDIWAVGRNGTLRYRTNAGWKDLDLPNGNDLNAIWGSSATDAWIVGDEGTVLHYDGSAWQAPPPPVASVDLDGIWRASSGELFVVGDNGTILVRSAAGVWKKESSGTTSHLHGVWGATLPIAWAVGSSGRILKRTATGWSQVASAGSTTTLHAIDGQSTNNITAVGGRCTTNTVTGLTTCVGRVSHFDGAKWSNESVGSKIFRDVKVGLSTTLVIGDAGRVYRSNGSDGWTKISLSGSPDLRAVWGTGLTVWVVGLNGASFVYSGGSFSTVPGAGVVDLYGLSGSVASGGSTDLVAVGADGKILRLEQGAWRDSGCDVAGTLRGVAMASPTDIWAVGSGGTLVHYDDGP